MTSSSSTRPERSGPGSPFPRQRRERRLCLADFFRRRGFRRDSMSIAFTVITVGDEVSEFTHRLFEANAYRDYLEAHGLSVQLTEALAEYWHRRIREELVLPGGLTAASERPGRRRGLLQTGLPRGAVLTGLRRLPGSRGSRQDRELAPTRAHRGAAVRGVPAAPGAVD